MSISPNLDQLVIAPNFRIKNFLYKTATQIDIELARRVIDELVHSLDVRRNIEYSLKTATRYSLSLTSTNSTDASEITKNRDCACHMLDVNFADFKYLLEVVKGTYIETIIQMVEKFHLSEYNKPLIGRHQLIWSLPGYCDYPLHRDRHTTHRYHIPIETTEEFYFIVEDEGVQYKLHLPADGGVWYLASRDVTHTIRHFGTTPRLHLLLTSSV